MRDIEYLQISRKRIFNKIRKSFIRNKKCLRYAKLIKILHIFIHGDSKEKFISDLGRLGFDNKLI